MPLILDEECNTEQGLVSEPSAYTPRRLSMRALVIGGLVALGFVIAGSAIILRKPQPEVLGNVDGVVGLAATCAGYTCPEGLIKLMGSKTLAQNAPNDAKCCGVCPRGWVQLGKTGSEAPGWGLSPQGATEPSVSTCANSCKDDTSCGSFKWHPTTKNCIHMSAADSTEEAQTSKWDNVVTCVQAACATTGQSTSSAGEGVPCVFPFRYKSVVYENCTSVGHNNMNPGGSQLDDEKLTTWCATEVQDGEAVAGKWGMCNAACNSKLAFRASFRRGSRNAGDYSHHVQDTVIQRPHL